MVTHRVGWSPSWSSDVPSNQATSDVTPSRTLRYSERECVAKVVGKVSKVLR